MLRVSRAQRLGRGLVNMTTMLKLDLPDSLQTARSIKSDGHASTLTATPSGWNRVTTPRFSLAVCRWSGACEAFDSILEVSLHLGSLATWALLDPIEFAKKVGSEAGRTKDEPHLSLSTTFPFF